MDFLRTQGFDLGIRGCRGFVKLYNKKRTTRNYKGKLEHPSLTFDLTAPKTELKPEVLVDDVMLYLCNLVEHQKTWNIAQFDRWNY